MMVTIKKEVTYVVEFTAQQKENLIIFLIETQKSDAAFMAVTEIYWAKRCDETCETITELLQSLEGL